MQKVLENGTYADLDQVLSDGHRANLEGHIPVPRKVTFIKMLRPCIEIFVSGCLAKLDANRGAI